MSGQGNAYSAGNAMLPYDLEDYERRMLSTAGSLSLTAPVARFSSDDVGPALEDYEQRMTSRQMGLEDGGTQGIDVYEGMRATGAEDALLSRSQAIDFYDWPINFGKGNPLYDQQAAEWVMANRAAIIDYPRLHKAKFRGSTEYKGYSYDGNPAADPLPDWQLTDPAQAPVYEGIRKELFGEGSATSINTYDDQILTIGWGFSVKNELGLGVLAYTMQKAPAFKQKLLGAGFNVDAKTVSYLDTGGAAGVVLSGEAALQKVRWDGKLLSQLIYAGEADLATYMDGQVKIFKQHRMKDFPAEGFRWPVDSARLAIHLKHWLPVGIQWAGIRNSAGDVATIIKHFCQHIFDYQEKNNKPNYYLRIARLPNSALFVDDVNKRFHMGNDAMVKAGNAGTIPTIAIGGFADKYKTDALFATHCFVLHDGKVYLLR